MPFFTTNEIEDNIINMQIQYNNMIQNNCSIYNNNKIFKNDNSLDNYQESNSNSHLSTTSEGEGNNNNISEKDENKSLDERIKKGIKDIKDYFNSVESLGDVANLACYYHCNFETSEDENIYVNMEVKKLAESYEKDLKNKINNQNEF